METITPEELMSILEKEDQMQRDCEYLEIDREEEYLMDLVQN